MTKHVDLEQIIFFFDRMYGMPKAGDKDDVEANYSALIHHYIRLFNYTRGIITAMLLLGFNIPQSEDKE